MEGALSYLEGVADDINASYGVSFPEQVNAKVHKEFGEMPGAESFSMPFDVSKMAYGGFKTLVQG